MKIIIQISSNIFDDLRKHLLAPKRVVEEAAFVFARVKRSGEHVMFDYLEHIKANQDDFKIQTGYHIELTDEFQGRVIKHAHDLKASLIEFHSHLGQEKARFSGSDWSGFSQFVPHVFWRLAKRPYAAVVVANSSTDALAWIDDPTKPCKVDSLEVGTKKMKPTSLSFQKYVE